MPFIYASPLHDDLMTCVLIHTMLLTACKPASVLYQIYSLLLLSINLRLSNWQCCDWKRQHIYTQCVVTEIQDHLIAYKVRCTLVSCKMWMRWQQKGKWHRVALCPLKLEHQVLTSRLPSEIDDCKLPVPVARAGRRKGAVIQRILGLHRNDLATAVWWVLSSDSCQRVAAVHGHWKSLLVEDREERTFIMLYVLWLSWLKPAVQCGPSQQREGGGERGMPMIPSLSS